MVEPPPLVNKRPPNMPGMMPPGSTKPPDDDLPDFAVDLEEEVEGDDDFERVEAQEDLDAAMEVEVEDEEKEEEEEEQTDELESISPASTERAIAKVLELFEPALGAALGVRGDEDKRLKDTNRQMD